MNRNLLVLLVFVLGLVSVSVHAQDISLTKKQLLNKKVEILVPAAFGEMTKELLKLKYPSERRPTMAYTDSSAKTNVAVN
ncbi:hypothetical protein [Rufibacter roseolus]|uniref:hypothetical protein n=1 Tax=Rufibacter roseolus TaxID=2817375 RepID=UPI001B317995|nr:hypothetical protein [Rufibacter roseolus]